MALVVVPLLVVDLAFFGANLLKIPAWRLVPAARGRAVLLLMSTWKQGRDRLSSLSRDRRCRSSSSCSDIERAGTGAGAGGRDLPHLGPSGAPPVLLHHLKHNKVLHERVVLLSVQTREFPWWPTTSGCSAGTWARILGDRGVLWLHGNAGRADLFAERRRPGSIKMNETTFYLGRETIIPTGKAKLAHWRKHLFIVMARNAQSATAFFSLPPNPVVELGAQIQL